MSINMVSFIKGMLPSFSRSDIESDLEISLSAIPAIQSSYASLEDMLKGLKLAAPKNKDLINEFYVQMNKCKCSVKFSPGKNIGTDILTLIKNAELNGKWVFDELSDAVNDVIVSQALTAYKANLLRAVPHYYFITRFAMDMLNYIYLKEAENAGEEYSSEFGLNKKQMSMIEDNLWIFVRLISVYGDVPAKFKANIEKIEQITLPKDKVEEAVETYNSDRVDLFNNLPAGFVGSPIYSIRLIAAEWEADRYRSIKDKRRLLELRFLHLKLIKEQGAADPSVEKEIESLQKRLTTMDMNLAKIDKDLE